MPDNVVSDSAVSDSAVSDSAASEVVGAHLHKGKTIDQTEKKYFTRTDKNAPLPKKTFTHTERLKTEKT